MMRVAAAASARASDRPSLRLAGARSATSIPLASRNLEALAQLVQPDRWWYQSTLLAISSRRLLDRAGPGQRAVHPVVALVAGVLEQREAAPAHGVSTDHGCVQVVGSVTVKL